MVDSAILQDTHCLVEQVQHLDEVGLERTREGYYYIAHYPPLNAMNDVSSDKGAELVASVTEREFETYMHIPYCEILCTFCHFDKELIGRNHDEKEARLIAAETKEMEFYKTLLGGKIQARSFYIGGGTPSVLSARGLVQLLECVNDNLDIKLGAEVKFELFPREYDPREIKEKLRILKDFGFTDVVIDLESGNTKSLRQVGRSNSSLDTYKKLVEYCSDAGFDSVVTALMVGMPHETIDSLHNTLEELVGIPEVKVINAFPLITREPDPIVRHVRSHPEWFPDLQTRDEMLVYARKYLQAQGFTEGPIAYMRRGDKRPDQQADKFECVNLLAFGPSGFGYLNGEDWAAQYFNFCNRDEYFDGVNSRKSAMWRAGVMNQEERARRKLIFGLANCGEEDLVNIEKRFGISVDKVFGRTLNALEDLRLIEISGKGVRYTQKGLCRLEEVSYFLGSDKINKRAHGEIPNDQFRLDIMRRNYYIRISPESERKFKMYTQQFPREFIHKIAQS